MGDLVITILIFVGVVAVTTVLFGGWLIVSAFKGVWRLIDGKTSRAIDRASTGRNCGNPGCRLTNPTHARFCRRCGTDLGHIAGPLVTRENRGLKIAS